MEPSAAERISPLKNINSIDQVFTKQHISQRPKSTPLWFIGNTEKILAWSQPPKTASQASVRKEGCERVRQLEEEPWRRQKLNSHLKPKKNKPPPWQKNLENPMVPLLETSGYVIMKNNCKYNTIVKSDDFFNGEPKDIRKKPNTVERNELLEQLHQQIDDLTIFLEEERFSHKQTKLRDEKILKEKLDDYCNWHNSEIREILASHEENLKKLKLEHQDELETYKDEMENRLRKSKEEYEVLQSAFRSHSNHLLEEMDAKWVKKEQELKEYYKDQQKTNFEKLRCKKIEEENQIKMAAMKAQRKEIETLKKEHRKQLQALASQYKDVTQRLETLDITEEMLSKARAELVDLKDQHGKLNKKLTSATEELTECSDCPTKAAISSLDTVLKKFADVVFPYPTTTAAAQETRAIAQLAKSITLKTIQLPTTINSLYRTGASPGVHACEDISPFCRQFTSAFLCHRPRIRESCQNSCGVCDSVKSHDCTDMNVHDCQSLLIAGKCNQTFVKTYCPLSCSACTASPFAASCFDRADNCKELLAQGFCDLAETLMRNACRLSCGFCK